MIIARRLTRAAARQPGLMAARHRRMFSWSDYNPLNYFYGSKKPDGGAGQAGGSSGEAGGEQTGAGSGQTGADGGPGGEYVAAGYIAPTPVVVDFRNSDSLIDDSEEPLKKMQNFGRMTRLIFVRYRKQMLLLASKFLKTLLEDYYEYGLLLFVFFVL